MLVSKEVRWLIHARIGLLVQDQIRLLVHAMDHLIRFKIVQTLCNSYGRSVLNVDRSEKK